MFLTLQVLPNGDLIVRAIQFPQNMGIYTCQASNEFGSDQEGAFVYPVSR